MSFVVLEPELSDAVSGIAARPTQGPSWGYLKSQFSRDLVNFRDECPQNGSKNDPMAPRTTLGCPHEGPRVDSGDSGDRFRAKREQLEILELSPYSSSPNLASTVKAIIWP